MLVDTNPTSMGSDPLFDALKHLSGRPPLSKRARLLSGSKLPTLITG